MPHGGLCTTGISSSPALCCIWGTRGMQKIGCNHCASRDYVMYGDRVLSFRMQTGWMRIWRGRGHFSSLARLLLGRCGEMVIG
ncbi:hypothetical protein C2845_PM08G02130 [Panicum miliaceum]|uniref:Uncharacterized protein n=1 Tax=Panicum miliaceum TaxID=4540 RepID=A0A3L6R365_PANMI|nr:hypothetical protein C2845_PM08G02130 [Panicum miliaceum]